MILVASILIFVYFVLSLFSPSSPFSFPLSVPCCLLGALDDAGEQAAAYGVFVGGTIFLANCAILVVIYYGAILVIQVCEWVSERVNG